MPDDDWQLAQGTVDFRNEERRAAISDTIRGFREAHQLPDLPLAFCTCTEDCAAQADEHLENCPVEARLREDLGF